MKIKNIPYERVEIESVREFFSRIERQFLKDGDAAAQFKTYMEYDKFLRRFLSMSALANVRFTQNVEDKFYAAEMDYYDEITPEFNQLSASFFAIMLDSAHMQQLKQLLSHEVVNRCEIAVKLYSPAAAEEYKRENRLITRYTKLMSSGTVQFRGETLAITELGKYKMDNDRDIRREAFNAHGSFLQHSSAEIDEIFDDLVKTRTAIAKKLGYNNYVEYAYDMRGRNSYNIDDVQRFRNNILKHVVPAATKLKRRQAQELGIDRIMLYDEPIVLKEGLPRPKGTPEQIMQAGRAMYREMSPLTAEFIEFMFKHDSFDVIARKGKSGGGYCTNIPDYKLPFIFSNFNGTSDDIDVLTHEAGHALFEYVTRDRQIYDRHVGSGMETYEVHSMSMEFFALKWMELFFEPQDAQRYRRAHFANAFSFLPYGTIVDYFQEQVYLHPELTFAQRNELWNSLECKFRPYLSTEGITYIENGTRWQYQSHIFSSPFYYIDYCVAQSVAFSFMKLIEEDRAAAWDKYIAFMQSSHLKFKQILRIIKLPSPFEEDTVKDIAALANINY